MINYYRGAIEVDIDGPRQLRFGWDALARLSSELGQRYDQVILRAAESGDVDVLAKVLAIGLNDQLTPEQIKEISPPVDIVSRAILAALSLAVWGSIEPPEEEEQTEVPQNRKVRRTLLQKLGGWLSGSGGRRATSGHQVHMS